MEPFTTHTGIPVPLRRAAVDTDQIIPAVYLKRITRTGFADGLFSAWRADQSFVLNQAPFDAGTILVAGPDFGVGSSREHAVWALQDYGFRVVVSPRFGPIFANNAGQAGLLLARLPQDQVEAIWAVIEAAPGAPMTVDLNLRTLSLAGRTWVFDVDDHTRDRLLAGIDSIGETLAHEGDIAAFEVHRPAFRPATLPLPVP
ncbi:MAG: 3-isopropylmalate dehydratase small subunit [Actinomycetia bacterium]|nr:3-isopropylmalate dehydratase small subunit [Actinomycetes bacterium]